MKHLKKILSVLLVLAMVIAWVPPITASAEEQTHTITFDANKTQRTEFSTTKQVWVSGALTMTNNKASSTSSLGDNTNPIRLYAHTNLVLECEGMTKIVFEASGSSYVTPLKNSISKDFAVSTSGNFVTVAFTKAVNSFTISDFTAQVRLKSIKVTALVGGGDEGGSEGGETPSDPVMHDVSFNLNGYEGAAAPATIQVEDGKAYGDKLPSAPEREGYTFEGWAMENGTIVTAETIVSASHILYAQWEKETVVPDPTPDTPEGEPTELTITFDDTAKRIECSTNKQVWQENEITITHNKGTGSNIDGQYFKPIRFYKNSNFTVECGGKKITKIVFNANTTGYASDLNTAIKKDNYSSSVNGKVVTVIFENAVDSFAVTLTEAKVFVDSITVTVLESTPVPETNIPEYFTYTTEGTNLTITGYTGTGAEVVIESTYIIDGTEYTVTAIGNKAFENCDNMISISIPEGIISIGESAFFSCAGLTEIKIPDSATSIGIAAFSACTRLESVIIGKSVTSIGGCAFENCRALMSIIIPKGVTSIEWNTFCSCWSLTEVTIPDSVTNIGGAAFLDCVAIDKVYYLGTEEQKAKITINTTYNDPLLNATWVCQKEENAPNIVENWGVTLRDEVIMKFDMNFTPEILADNEAYVEVAVNGSAPYTVSVAEDMILSVPVFATQMTETITLTTVSGGEAVASKSFTLLQYCKEVLNNNEYSQYHALVKELLNYGDAAMKYFKPSADKFAGEEVDLAGTGKHDVPVESPAIALGDQSDVLDCTGASLVYRDKIAVRYYFTGSLTGCTFSVTGASGKAVVNAAGGYVEVPDILPQNLDQEITLSVTDGEGKVLTITYCPMNYIVRMSQKGSDTTKALVKALYNYYLAAKDFAAQTV